jgi:amidase
VICELSASEAAARIREGSLTAEALVDACLARIAEREEAVGAWEFLDRDGVLEAARAAERSEPLGALHGVPIGVKDTIDTADMPTALGSRIYAGRRPQQDAACVAALRAGGGIVLGKTVTTEFAAFAPGKTRNPHASRRTPGGSSSGSAAAVADFMVPLAFGSQTAASVIRPASFCGVIGYKASFGELSLSGIRPLAQSLDTLGILARSIADIALLRSVCRGTRARARLLGLAPSPTIGICRTAQWVDADECTKAAFEASADAFRRAGARTATIDLPESFALLIDAQKTIMAFEVARNYRFELAHHADRLSASFRALIEAGTRIAEGEYRGAQEAVLDATDRFPAIVGECDALIAPATIGEAPLAEAGTGDPLMSRMWTALHVPALAVPVGRGPQGLPVGVQINCRLRRRRASAARRAVGARGARAE